VVAPPFFWLTQNMQINY